MESSSSASSGSRKRARAHGSLNQVPCCLVDGCMADLAKCRDYHRRHKVCEAHSKTPKVTIRGLEQRFCQQCSRFHSLGEFDEGKRSCRKRLDGHNRRRRKAQPDSDPLTHGRFLPSPQGSSFMAFSSTQVFPTTAVTSAWVDAEIQSQISFSSSSRNSLIPAAGSSSDSNSKEEKAFPFLHGTASSLPCVPVTQPHFSLSSTTDRKMFSHGSTAMVNSTSALSLLSPHPAHIVEPHSSQSMINTNLHYTTLGMVSERAGSGAPASDGHMHEQAVLRGTSHGSAATASHHTLSFSWE